MGRYRALGQALRLAIVAGLLVAAIMYRGDIARAAVGVANLDPIVVLVLPLYALWNYLAAFGWRALQRVLATGSIPSAWRLSLIRIQAQALNLVLPLASVGGDVLRATILSRRSGQVAGSTSAVVLDKIADGAGGLAFSLLGIMLGLTAVRDQTLIIAVLSSILIAALAFLPLALGLFGKRIASSGTWWARALAPLAHEPKRLSLAFYQAIGWHILERLLTGVEIYLAMVAAGLAVTPMDALFVAAVMTAYTLVFFFVPGQLGAAEAGIVSAFTNLGLSASLGLTVALVRRARQLLIILVGAMLFVIRETQQVPLVDQLAETEPKAQVEGGSTCE